MSLLRTPHRAGDGSWQEGRASPRKTKGGAHHCDPTLKSRVRLWWGKKKVEKSKESKKLFVNFTIWNFLKNSSIEI